MWGYKYNFFIEDMIIYVENLKESGTSNWNSLVCITSHRIKVKSKYQWTLKNWYQKSFIIEKYELLTGKSNNVCAWIIYWKTQWWENLKTYIIDIYSVSVSQNSQYC